MLLAVVVVDAIVVARCVVFKDVNVDDSIIVLVVVTVAVVVVMDVVVVGKVDSKTAITWQKGISIHINLVETKNYHLK